MKFKKKSVDQRRRETRERIRRLRQNPEYRNAERIANTAAHRLAMKDPEKRAAHQIADAASHRRARRDPAKRQAHRVRDAAAHRRALQDPQRRAAHRLRDAAAHQKALANSTKRQARRIRDAVARHGASRSPEVLQVQGSLGQFITYPGKRAHGNTHWDLVKQEAEHEGGWQNIEQDESPSDQKDVKLEVKYNLDYETLFPSYQDTNPLNTDHIGSWYGDSVKIITKEELISKGFSDDQINGILM